MEHQWSAINVPLMWAAAGHADGHPLLEWMCELLDFAGDGLEVAGENMTSGALRNGFRDLRAAMRHFGIMTPAD
eukprot:7366963-Pyramimonas_sp.AAC.1